MIVIMDLIPITKIKIDKQKWLDTKIKYEDNKNIKEVLQEMSFHTYSWMNNQAEFNIIIDYESFEGKYIQLMYDKYLRF